MADSVNSAEGRSFSEIKSEMHNAYLAGRSNKRVNPESFTDIELKAYTAGRQDTLINQKKSRGQFGQSLKSDLIRQGVPHTDIKNIIQTVTNIERSLGGTERNISYVFSGACKITNNLAKAISQKVGNVQNIYGLLHTNLKFLQQGSLLQKSDLVLAYADTYLNAMKNNDSKQYSEVSAGIHDVPRALAEYITTGKMQDGVKNQDAFLYAAEDVAGIAQMANDMLSNAREQLYGNITISAEKDILSNEKSNDIMETSTGTKVSYSLSGNVKTGQNRSGRGRRSATRNQQMRVFPPFNESRSDANERATRWAHRDDVDEGAMKIAFYHNEIYLIEKNTDSELGYQIIKKINKKEYNKWLQKNRSAQYDKDTGKQSNGKDANKSRSGNRENDPDGRVKSGSNRDFIRHGGKVQDVSGVDKFQDGWGNFEHERDGDYEYRFKDKSDEINYPLESEVNKNEQEQDLLSDDSSKRKYSKSSGRQARKVDGRSSRYKEGREAASERREHCQALKDAGYTRKRVILGHHCEVIPKEHYDLEMTKLVKENKKNGIDETILVVGGIELPRVSNNGKLKTAKGMFIETTDGRRIVVVQYDNEYYSPKQINDHELVHNNYGSERTQRVKNIILKTLPIKKRYELLGIIQDDYSDILEDLEGDAIEEAVADILSGMHNLSNDFIELSKAYWNKDDAFIKRWEYEVNKKSFARAVEKGYASEMERINRQLAYDEYAQLNEYIMDVNNRHGKLKKADCTEIGNNFYIWRNISKTNYEVIFDIPIEGNENFVKFYRNGVNNNDRTTKNIWKMYTSYNAGSGNGFGGGATSKGTIANGRNGRLFTKKSVIDGRGNSGESNRDTSENKVKYALDENGMWEMEHIFENDDPEAESAMMQDWKSKVEEYGAIPKGEKPARDIDVPKKITNDKKVSQTVRTILEAKATPDEALPTIEKMALDGAFSYDTYTDKQAIADAEGKLKEDGWLKSYNKWMNDVKKGTVSKQHTVLGWALYNNAVNRAAETTSEDERKTAMETALDVIDAMDVAVSVNLFLAKYDKRLYNIFW